MDIYFATMSDLKQLLEYLRVTREQWTREQKRRELPRSPELAQYLAQRREDLRRPRLRARQILN